MSQPKLTLRPPPHRDFIQGFPGIVESGSRPPAHVAGTVEVRLGPKGLKAAWLRIELRKLETLPGGESWGELIGRGPIDVWSARKDEAYKTESEKGWELLQTADFPFQVTIPEGLPPSAKLDKQAGISYELVTSLCVRTKKGLLKKETTSSVIQNTHPLWLDKHELHSTWPIYSVPEDHEAIQDDISVKVMRNRTCHGPGDSVDARIIISSKNVSPVKIKSISCSVRETITFKGSAKKFSSNKAASQKTETLSSKTKSFGKKVYKGDVHTFDLSCLIPKTHNLMSIQTAKHIEVSYTLRVQVETPKKPIIIDHLPVTVSSFTRAASDALMGRIGWVPGLSTPSEDYRGGSSTAPSTPSTARQPIITRSMSFSGSAGRSAYPGYPGGDLRRRDTVMTQGTTVSGPGMAGRGVPGQIFSWGQYGSAQPFGTGEAPRPAFAGPPSIYDGPELAPEENRALFHSTNRPQSAMVLGTAVDPVLLNGSSYHGHSGGVTPIQEGSSENFAQSSNYHRQAPPQQEFRRQSQFGGNASPGGYNQPQGMRYSAGGAASADHRNSPISPNGDQNYSDLAYRGSGTPDLGTNTRYVQPVPIHQSFAPQRQDSPAPATPLDNSAEGEKQRLYERARQQAERNQRRADERRALHQGTSSPSTPLSPVANGGRPFSILNLGSSSASPSPQRESAAVAGLTAEAEKMRLFQRARAEAEKYQNSYHQGSSFPAMDAAPAASPQEHATSCQAGSSAAAHAGGYSMVGATASPSAPIAAASSTVVSGRAAPYSSYMSAEEEKRQLYERAKAETERYQRGEASTASDISPSASNGIVPVHQQAASFGTGIVEGPGAYPNNTQVASSFNGATPRPAPPAIASSSTAVAGASGPSIPAISEKEQLRRYYEARDAVSQHLQQAGGSQAGGSGASSAQDDRMYTPEVASAVHHATPHQPADTVGTPTRAGAAAVGVQSYLTEAEQQSAEEKERLASHYARKAAKAEAKAVVRANGRPQAAANSATAQAYQSSPVAGGSGSGSRSGGPAPSSVTAAISAASEKAQLAAYYAARDAMQTNLRAQSTAPQSVQASGSCSADALAQPNHHSTHQPMSLASSSVINPAQWRPKFNSLDDESDIDLIETRMASSSSASAPPPLPPKIPLASSVIIRQRPY